MTPQRRLDLEYGLWFLKWSDSVRGKPLVGSMLRDVWMAGHAAALNPTPQEELTDGVVTAFFAEDIRRHPITSARGQ
jgi:hypothetical protein